MICMSTRSEPLPCAVSVPPTLEVRHAESENQVNVTCQVKNFYPQHLQLTWLENGNMSRTGTPLTRTENKDGTFTWGSWLLVNSSARREAVVLTCLVQHDGQPAVSRNLTLEASAHRKDLSTDGPSGEASTPTDPLFFSFFLSQIFFFFFLIFIQLQLSTFSPHPSHPTSLPHLYPPP